VQAITAGVLAGSADMVAQKLAGAKNLQFRRSLLLMVSSGLSCGCRFQSGISCHNAQLQLRVSFFIDYLDDNLRICWVNYESVLCHLSDVAC